MNESILEEKFWLLEIEQDVHTAEDWQQRIILNGVIQEFLEHFGIMQI